MHDDTSYFQYFALDFNEGFSAFHGGDVFAQAHATNRAIQKIVNLYAKKKDMNIGRGSVVTALVMRYVLS